MKRILMNVGLALIMALGLTVGGGAAPAQAATGLGYVENCVARAYDPVWNRNAIAWSFSGTLDCDRSKAHQGAVQVRLLDCTSVCYAVSTPQPGTRFPSTGLYWFGGPYTYTQIRSDAVNHVMTDGSCPTNSFKAYRTELTYNLDGYQRKVTSTANVGCP